MRPILFILVLVAFACSKSKSPSASSENNQANTEAPANAKKPAEQKPVVSPAAPVIKLVSAGTPPLRKLRYTFEKGQKHTIAIERELMVAAKAGEGQAPRAPGPRYTFELALEIKEVRPDGSADVEFVVNKADVEANTSKGIQAELQEGQAVNKVRGMRGRYSVGANGLVTKIEIDSGDDFSHRSHQAVEAIRLALFHLTVPVPDAEVGKASQWTVTRASKQHEMNTTKRLTVGVASFEEDGVAMRMIVQRTASQQSVTSRGRNPQAFELLALKEQGMAEGTWMLDKPVPNSASASLKNHMKLRNAGITGEIRGMETLRETTLKIASK